MLWSILAQQVMVGQAPANDTPLRALQSFKGKLDENDLVAACGLMAESDGSGPLKREHYEQMQTSLDGLAKMWEGVEFYFGGPEVNTSKQPNVAVATASLNRPKQEVNFTLLKFGTNWYISDIQIFFK